MFKKRFYRMVVNNNIYKILNVDNNKSNLSLIVTDYTHTVNKTNNQEVIKFIGDIVVDTPTNSYTFPADITVNVYGQKTNY